MNEQTKSRENALIELHDSEIERVDVSRGELALHFSHAYVHRSAGDPGRDPGTGWSQRAVLLFGNATMSGEEPRLPAQIASGDLWALDAAYPNAIPIPFSCSGPIKLTLIFSTGQSFTVEATSALLDLIGEPRFIEIFDG